MPTRPPPTPSASTSSPSAAVRHDRPRVAIVYHFFAHYRAAVMRELCLSPDRAFEVELVSDLADPTGDIEPWDFDAAPGQAATIRFTRARCRHLRGPVIWQHGLVRLALRRDLSAIVYLGNALWPATWLSAGLARLTGKRVWFWTHGWTEPDRGLKAFIRRRFYRLANGLLLYGHMAKMLGLEAGFAAESLHVIYNSLDVERQRAIRSEVTPDEVAGVRARLFPEARPDAPMVICTSRLTASRRFDLLIEALAQIRETHGRAINLLLVGGGPEEAALREHARERGVCVHFYGPCYDDRELAPLIMAADVTVAPGNVGLTAMHSMVYGVPVITHDDWQQQGPEFETIIEGRTGGLFRRGDLTGLVEAILRFTNGGTAAERAEVRRACVAVIDRFYNPVVQRRAIERALRGEPANDLADHAGRAAPAGPADAVDPAANVGPGGSDAPATPARSAPSAPSAPCESEAVETR